MAHSFPFRCLKCSLVAVFLLIVQVASTQSRKPTGPLRFKELAGDVENRKKDFGGELSVLVADRDSVLHQQLIGEVNLRTQAPLGAASAWLSTALVLQLADEGLLSLDDKVAQYLPVFGSYAKNYVTIRHCLVGLTGVQSEPVRTANFTAKPKHESLDAEAADFAKREIKTNAGEAHFYNPFGVNVAARIAEIVTKKKFDQLMRQRIFTPLGMRNTTYATDDGSASSPATGARTTGADMIRFLQMLLNNGSFGGKQILSPDAVAEMRKVQVDPSKMKAVPKLLQGLQQTAGAWALEGEEGAGKTAAVLVSPGFTGAWPMVDFARGYAFVLLPKSFVGEQNVNVYEGLKVVLDEELKKATK